MASFFLGLAIVLSFTSNSAFALCSLLACQSGVRFKLNFKTLPSTVRLVVDGTPIFDSCKEDAFSGRVGNEIKGFYPQDPAELKYSFIYEVYKFENCSDSKGDLLLKKNIKIGEEGDAGSGPAFKMLRPNGPNCLPVCYVADWNEENL